MIRVFKYKKDEMTEDTPEHLEGIRLDPIEMIWVDLTEPPDDADQQVLSRTFGIHPLTIENLFEGTLHPRLMEYDHHIFLNARAIIAPNDDVTDLTSLAVVLGERYVLTAHCEPLDLVERTLERVRINAGHVRELGPDHLFYMLLDGLVDDYFVLVDSLSDRDRRHVGNGHRHVCLVQAQEVALGSVQAGSSQLQFIRFPSAGTNVTSAN